MTEDHDSDAVRVFWEDFDSAWRDGGALSAEEISARLQRERNYSLAVSTVRGWLEHKRLPRKDEDFTEMCLLLVGKDRTNQLMARLVAARQAVRTHPRTPPDSSPPTAGANKLALIWRQRSRSLRPWHAAAAAVLVVSGVLVGLALRPADEAPSGTPAPPAQPASGGGSTTPDTPDGGSPCPTPTVRAEAKDGRASATFCTEPLEFLLSDNSSDGKSAILVVRVNGKELAPWFNTKGYVSRLPNGEMVRKPSKRIPISFSTSDTAEFRVCFDDFKGQPTYPDPKGTCGDWTQIWPRR